MAAGRDMVARFVLRLRDQVSPGIDALRRRLDALRTTANRIGAIGAIVAGISFMAPIREAAAFNDVLLQTAITAGQAGSEAQAAAARMARSYERLATATAQPSQAIAEAAADLQASGLERTVIEQLMPTLARTATATGATLQDLAKLAIGLNQNLRIGPDEMADALGALAQAGKEGRFELRDMAREFPAITAAAQALGMTGRASADRLAAMLQVIRTGTATGSEAATNLQNLMTKITSPDTVRNFREAGTDLPRLIAEAARRNINPVEAVIQEVRRISQGDMFRVGELFGDMQVLGALRPFMTGSREYIRILEAVAQANRAVIETDFSTRTAGQAASLALLDERVTQLGRTVGNAFSGNLGWMNDLLGRLQEGMEAMETAAPGVLGQILTLAGGATVLAGVLGVLGVVLPAIGAGVALVGGPIGVAAIAIVAAGVAIWRYWDELGVFFAGLWERLKAGFSDLSATLSNLVNGEGQIAWLANAVRTAWAPLGDFFAGLLDGIGRRFRAFLEFVQPVIDAANRLFGTSTGEGAASNPEGQAARRQAMGARGAAGGFYAPEASAPAQRVTGEIVVRATPGTEVEQTRSSDRGLPITPERGQMLGAY